MAIKQDKNNPGTFVVSYSARHPITRKPVTLMRKGFKTMREAQRAYNDLVVEVKQKIHKTVVPTWSKVLTEFYQASADRGLSKKTIYDYRTCLDAHTLGPWKDLTVDSITTQDIRNLLQKKFEEKAPSYQRYFLKGVRSVFTYALEAAYIVRNPVPQMKFKVGDKIQRVLTEDQACLLLAKAEEQNWPWYPHYAMALYTGMRSGELYALRWENVDLEQRTILVNCAWNSKDGLKSTKSGDDRMIEISPALLPLMRKLQAEADGAPNVLPILYQWQKGEQAKHLATFLTANGLPEVRFHDLRATWATILLSKGVEPIKVMKMGGWKDLETMMIYARKAGVDIRGASDCLNFGNPEGKILKLANL